MRLSLTPKGQRAPGDGAQAGEFFGI